MWISDVLVVLCPDSLVVTFFMVYDHESKDTEERASWIVPSNSSSLLLHLTLLDLWIILEPAWVSKGERLGDIIFEELPELNSTRCR